MSPGAERASWLLDRHRPAEAEAAALAALATDPEDGNALFFRTRALRLLGRIDEAFDAAHALLAQRPDSPWAHIALGECHASAGGWVEAEACAREAVRLDPAEPDFRALLAGRLSEIGQHQEALGVVEEGLRLDPVHLKLKLARSLVLTRQQHPEASASTLDALRLDPTNFHAQALRAAALHQAGDHEGALEVFRDVLRQDPTDPDVLNDARVAVAALYPGLQTRVAPSPWTTALSRGLWVAVGLSALLALWAAGRADSTVLGNGSALALTGFLIVGTVGAHVLDPGFYAGTYLFQPPPERRRNWGRILVRLLGAPILVPLVVVLALPLAGMLIYAFALSPSVVIRLGIIVLLAVGALFAVATLVVRALWFRASAVDELGLVALPFLAGFALVSDRPTPIWAAVALAAALTARGLLAVFRRPEPLAS